MSPFDAAMKWLREGAPQPQGMLAHVVISNALHEAMEEAFIAGFLVSGEGYNGEYPHDFLDGETLRKEMMAPFAAWLEKRRKAMSPPEA